MLQYLQKYNNQGYQFIIGVDEAGRGPLAGPVVASAVFLKETTFQSPIRDSKKCSFKQREDAFDEISRKAYFGVGMMSEAVIDRVNILQATFLAMHNAVVHLLEQLPDSLRGENDFNDRVILLIDGNRFKSDLPFRHETIVQGDSKELSIACASIVAKVMRDRILAMYDQVFPEYGFNQHKGYPTEAHKKAIQDHGLSLIHRRSFRYQ